MPLEESPKDSEPSFSTFSTGGFNIGKLVDIDSTGKKPRGSKYKKRRKKNQSDKKHTKPLTKEELAR